MADDLRNTLIEGLRRRDAAFEQSTDMEIVDWFLAEIGRTHAVVPKEMPNATAWAICQEADICGSDPCGKCPAEEICHGEPSIRGCRLMARNAYRAALKAATPPASTGGGEGG